MIKETSKETPKEALDQETPDRRVNTEARIKNDGVKRMPHERDESPDDQDKQPRGIMQQAASDLAEGLVDTDMHGQRGIEQAVQHDEGASASGQAKPQPDAAKGMRHQNSTVPPTTPPKDSKK
jgi:hypothetical protein